jgi:hypothetical protein
MKSGNGHRKKCALLAEKHSGVGDPHLGTWQQRQALRICGELNYAGTPGWRSKVYRAGSANPLFGIFKPVNSIYDASSG